ncbi:MAG TPA: ferrous iron transport protein B, partial [Spirochaetia bacterium]
LFLTTQLLDMKVPVVVVVNMMDLAEGRGIVVDIEALERQLGCPVVGISATKTRDARRVLRTLEDAWRGQRRVGVVPAQGPVVEKTASDWAARIEGVAAKRGTNGRWLALKLMERDAWATDAVVASGAMGRAEIERGVGELEKRLGESADIVLAQSRYDFIQSVTERSFKRPAAKKSASDRIDAVVLNRWLGIPIFLGIMYLLFWVTINLGGAFQDFFDILCNTVFVTGFGHLLTSWGTPSWLVMILANGLGAGIQTVSTFIPIIFAMFFMLSLLEDSGYMARAAFVMDRFMRWVGLPGKSFVPMLIGFGCNVPAIMATRTLENKRDRYLTIFMNPLMSCGARLPVYALFGAAFFGAAAGTMVFSLYLVGIVVAILTGLLMKRTLFKGEAAYFVMELPPYHAPKMRNVLQYSWRRLLAFMTRAKFIIPIVVVLAVLNSLGLDGTLGNENTPKSTLSTIGKAITPVFEPMGVEKANWPATVGIFTGILAKETVVGTLSSLYSQNAAAEAGSGGEDTFNFWAGISGALVSIPDNLKDVVAKIGDPLGISVVGKSQDVVAEDVGADTSVFAGLRNNFTGGPLQAYAYLLFVLLYIPCVAAFAAMTKEMGLRYTLLSAGYLLVTAWSAGTLFYQIALGGQALWIAVALGLLAAMVLGLWLVGRRGRERTGTLGLAEGGAA